LRSADDAVSLKIRQVGLENVYSLGSSPTLISFDAFRFHSYRVSSWLLFSAIGCLGAAFAMRCLQRSGEQL
jgi:hypothetical protein